MGEPTVFSLVVQLIKNPPAIQETLVPFLSQEDPLEKDRLPTPVFLGFPGGSAGREYACNAGDLVSLGWEDPWKRERLLTPVFWPGEFHGLYGPQGSQDLDMSDFHMDI